MTDKILPIKTNSITDDYIVYWNNKLGTGVSGPVRLCQKRSDNRQFAVKCLADTPRSRTEVRLHWLCGGHKNIVDVYQIYANDVQFPREPQTRARLMVVMELMEGGELFDRISKERCFTERKAANYMRQIARCLNRCHSLNVAHRDLKPENLLLKDDREDAQVKLSDFGFAKVDDGHLSTPQFTPYYVAPEVLIAQQLDDQRKLGIIPAAARSHFSYDKSCDMWSAGVVLYIMLCGYPPFYSETPSRPITEKMKVKIMCGEYEFPEDDWLMISSAAKDVVRRLLHVEPNQRMTVSDLLNHPWLVDAPDTALRSPSIISKEEFEDTKMAHSAQLTTLRAPDVTIVLKPIRQVNNPIMRKRMHRNRSGSAQGLDEEPPSKQSTRDEEILQDLKNIMSHCMQSHKLDDSGHVTVDDSGQTLNLLIKKAACGAENNKEFRATLERWHWDGEKFNESVDRWELAESVAYLLEGHSPGEGGLLGTSNIISDDFCGVSDLHLYDDGLQLDNEHGITGLL